MEWKNMRMLSSLHRHIGKGKECGPIGEIVEELEGLEFEAAETNVALKNILKALNV